MGDYTENLGLEEISVQNEQHSNKLDVGDEENYTEIRGNEEFSV